MMVLLPRPVIDDIYKLYKNEPNRNHLGCSELGEECRRKLWYSFRHVKPQAFDGRILRLFESGKREEVRILDELKKIGIKIYDIDPITKTQFSYTGCMGHLGGSIDAVGVGFKESDKPHVIEVKTHNQKSFDQLEKNGVEKSKQKHYVQVQLYMGLSECDRAMYIAVNKNTDELYVERIKFDILFIGNNF